MANKNIILDKNGLVIRVDDERVSTEESLILGQNVAIVPENILTVPKLVYDDTSTSMVQEDPRVEQRILMQKGTMGTGCTGGPTAGITGCGNYGWNETVYQNITKVETRDRGTSTTPQYDRAIKKFGTSSVKFGGLDSGTTGGVLLLHDIPGLTLAGPGGHIGGGAGASGAGVSGGYSGDVLLQMYFYITDTPSSDKILAMHGSSAAGGTGNSWKLYYDNGSTSLKFDFNNMGDTSTAWAHSMTVTAGVPVINKWHHVAIIYKSRWYGSNGSEVIPYYDNTRSETGISSGVINELLRTDQPLSIGAGQSGAYAFDGWIDDFHFQMGPSGGTVCRGFSTGTGSYATAGIQATMDAQSTLALMRFNGPSGCALFSVDSYERVKANVTRWDGINKVLGVRDIILTGNATGGFDYANGYVEGYNGSAYYQVSCTGGTLMSDTQKLSTKRAQFRQTRTEYMGLVGLSGSSGDSGDFPNLYGPHGSVGHGATGFIGAPHGFCLYPNDITIQRLSEHVSYMAALGGTAGTGGNYILQDCLGNCVGFSGGHIYALYQDVWTFRNNLTENVIIAECEVDSVGTADGQSYSQISEIKLNSSGIDSNKVSGFESGSGVPPELNYDPGDGIAKESAGGK